MNARHLKKKSETDWARIDQMTDDQIDTSDIPPLDDAFFERARKVLPRRDLERLDLLEARKFATHILDKKFNQEREAESERLIHRALNISLVISYSRPFQRSKDFKGNDEPSLNENISEVLNQPKLRLLHDRLLELRNMSVAHSDAGQRLMEKLNDTKHNWPFEGHLNLEKAEVELAITLIEKWLDYVERSSSLGRGRELASEI